MSLSAAAIRLMAEKGLSASDIADVAEANEPSRSSAAIRQQRYREKKAAAKHNDRDVTRDVTRPPNEDNSNPPVSPDAKASCPTGLSERVVEAWNEKAAARGARKSTPLNGSRRKHLSTRVREHGEDAVFRAIDGIASSDWHCGKVSDWRADLGWMLKSPENFQKALDLALNAAPANDAKPMTDADRAAYLKQIEGKPWANATPRAEHHAEPRKGNTGPPRSFGQLAAGIAESVQ